MELHPDDYYYEGPYMVFTAAYHLKRGYCCENGCRHCPYKNENMNPKTKAIFNWSGGKDSAFALHQLLEENHYDVVSLLTSVNEKYQRISMHGVRVELLEEQAKQLQLPLHKLMLPEEPSMEDYENIMHVTMQVFKNQGINRSVFGDIFLEDLRAYRENKLSLMGFKGVFPIWQKDTTTLIHEFLEKGFKTIVVCVDAQKLDKSFAGRIIDKDFIKDLPENVDPCGENGEFHTFCFDGPIFKKAIEFTIGETVFREYKKPNSSTDQCQLPEGDSMGFWFTDLLPIVGADDL